MYIQKVYKAKNIDEALKVLYVYKDRVAIVCGGTDIIVKLREGIIDKDILLDISDIRELKFIKEDEEYIKIGSATTISEIENSKLLSENLSGLKKAAALIGSPQIRNRGTIGGNICNASVGADLIPPLLALNSFVCLESKNYERHIMLSNFIKENNKALIQDDEIVKYIQFKKLNENQYLSFNKLGNRKAVSISRASSSVLMTFKNNKIENINIANGAVGSVVIRELEIEEFLKGKDLNINIINQACNKAKTNTVTRLWERDNTREKAYAISGILKKSMNDCINYFEGR